MMKNKEDYIENELMKLKKFMASKMSQKYHIPCSLESNSKMENCFECGCDLFYVVDGRIICSNCFYDVFVLPYDMYGIEIVATE